MVQKTNPHIEEYFSDLNESSEERAGRQLFKGGEDTDLKTDLVKEEIGLINTMIMNDQILKKYGLKNVFGMYYKPYMRLKISHDRKSRSEFVKVSSQDRSEDMVEGMRTAGSLFGGSK